MPTRVTYQDITKHGYSGWRRFLAYFEQVVKDTTGEARTLSVKTVESRLKKIRKQQEELEAQRRGLNDQARTIRAACPHPIDRMFVVSEGREDSYGSYQSGSDYQMGCSLCGTILAETSTEMEVAGKMRLVKRDDWPCWSLWRVPFKDED